MNKALITLTPLEPYFFGSELTHGDGGANYFAKSNRWPQQSSLCGLLRYLLFETVSSASRGPHSFDPETPGRNDYGDLLGISPLFLKHGEELFLRQALDRYVGDRVRTVKLNNAEPNNWVLTESRRRLYTEESDKAWQQPPRWETPEGKRSAADDWVGTQGNIVSADNIFMPFTRPGITKQRAGAPRKGEAGFYKQTAFRLAKGWSFAVLADFKDTVDLSKLNGACLPFGGEKTIFSIAVEPSQQTFSNLFDPAMFYPDGAIGPFPFLVLCSDTYLTEAAMKYVITGVTDTLDFRHIRTNLSGSTEIYGPLRNLQPNENAQNQTQTLTKSAKYTLFQRGSVLVCANINDLNALTQMLDITPWTTIGFNHYFTFNTQ